MRAKSKTPAIAKRSGTRYRRERRPIHPGEVLREEFLVPLSLSANSLAISIGVPATRVGEIVNERRGISADTALRLGRYFHMTPEFWMGLQSDYDLELARFQNADEIEESVRPAPLDRRTGELRRSVA